MKSSHHSPPSETQTGSCVSSKRTLRAASSSNNLSSSGPVITCSGVNRPLALNSK
jgi:hypothetical protein